MNILKSHCIAAVVVLLCAGAVQAGELAPPDGPGGANSAMFTLDDVYNRLNSGTTGSKQTFTEPGTGPTAGTMRSLNDVMGKAPAKDDTAGATAAQVLIGKTFWGLLSGGWGQVTGTMPNNGAVTITPGTSDQTIAAGYHNGSGKVTGDTGLTGGNIMAGTTLFGIAGKCRKLPATGQTTSYATGDDGYYQYGCAPAVAPVSGMSPNRTSLPWAASSGTGFIDNGNGTVTDTITGLIWLKNANCWGMQNWATALNSANTLASGSCGLTDGSTTGQWRLPNINELRSLVDTANIPALPSGHPFTNVQGNPYWSGNTYAGSTDLAWSVVIDSGNVSNNYKTYHIYVWPVRAGQ